MAKTIPTFNGHPCAVAAARAEFVNFIGDARRLAGNDWLVARQHIGRQLVRLGKRLEHTSHAAGVLYEKIDHRDSDSDPVAALAALADDYSGETLDLFCDLAGLVLVALDLGERHRQEAQHG